MPTVSIHLEISGKEEKFPFGPIVDPKPGPTFEIDVAAPEIAISGAATSISNVGPGLGSTIGPNGNFSSLPDISKWILTVGMILGRLELFAILILFVPAFWRN